MSDVVAPAAEASSNKRPLSPSPANDDAASASKRQNTKAEAADDDDDITADDKPLAGSVADGQADDVAMKDAAEGSTAAAAAAAGLPAPPPPQAADAGAQQAEEQQVTQQIQMRCLIVTQDASVIIGKGGKHVNEIREKSGARVNVSESIPGNPERILHVSGPLDAVSKAFGLIVRRINDEPFDMASVPGSRAVTIKFIIPNSRMGSLIGKGGSKIKEIQEASGARLNASEAMLPGSTERVLSVAGVADAVHIATFYIGTVLVEAASRGDVRGGGEYRGGAPGGAGAAGGDSYRPGGAGGGAPAQQGRFERAPQAVELKPGMSTQNVWIPNELVGPMIGKGGSKINEIRQASQTQIRIMEPHQQEPQNPNERLVMITGMPENVNAAVQMLHQRLEHEKQNRLQQQQ